MWDPVRRSCHAQSQTWESGCNGVGRKDRLSQADSFWQNLVKVGFLINEAWNASMMIASFHCTRHRAKWFHVRPHGISEQAYEVSITIIPSLKRRPMQSKVIKGSQHLTTRVMNYMDSKLSQLKSNMFPKWGVNHWDIWSFSIHLFFHPKPKQKCIMWLVTGTLSLNVKGFLVTQHGRHPVSREQFSKAEGWPRYPHPSILFRYWELLPFTRAWLLWHLRPENQQYFLLRWRVIMKIFCTTRWLWKSLD